MQGLHSQRPNVRSATLQSPPIQPGWIRLDPVRARRADQPESESLVAVPGLTPSGRPPSLRLRRLAAELRTLRQTARLTREAVADRTELNSATLWRIETGRVRPQRRTLLALMDLYGVHDERRRAELIDLIRPQTPTSDRSLLADVPPRDGHSALLHYESEAHRVRLYEWRFVPDLLQTERYAHAVLTGLHPDASSDEIDRLATVRAHRRARLGADPPIQVHALLDESALHRRVGDDRTYRAQLGRLSELAEAPGITIQVLPYEVGAHVGLPGTFSIIDFPDPADAGLVCVEGYPRPVFLEEPAALADHVARFERLCTAALDPDRSRSLISGLVTSGGPPAPRPTG